MMNDLNSVGLKFLLLLLPPLLITAVLVSAVFSFTELQDMRKAFEEKQGSVINFHTAVLASPLFSRDGDNVQKVLELLSLDPDVASAQVANVSGQTIARIENNADVAPQNTVTVSKEILFSSAVADVDDYDVGSLSVTFRTDQIETAVLDRALRDFFFVGIVSVVLLLVAYVAGRTVFVTPLRQFLDGIEIAKDRMSREPLVVKTKDEIGQVMNAYNDLLLKLEDEEREKERSTRLYKLIAENASDSILMRNLKGEYVHYSSGVERMTGYDLDELVAMDDIADLIHPEDRPRVDLRIEKMRAGQTDFPEPERYRWIRKDGAIRWNEAKIVIVPGLDNPAEFNVLTAIHDITDLIEKQNELEESRGELERQAEELIHLARDLEDAKVEAEQSSRMFRILAENATNWISLFDLKGKCSYVSPSTETLSGYTADEAYSGSSILNVIHPDHKLDLLRLRRQLAKGEVARVSPYLSRIIRKDGVVRWHELQMSLVPSLEGYGGNDILVSSHDVTELIESREALRSLASELETAKVELEDTNQELERNSRLFKILADNANDSIALRTMQGHYFYYSPSSERLSGFTVDELLAKGDINAVVHPEDLPGVEQRRRDMEAGKVDPQLPLLFRFVKKDGEVRWGQARVTVVPGLDDPREPNVMTAITDITDLIEKQKELEESEEELRTLANELEAAKSDLESVNLELERSSRLFKVLADNANDSISLRKMDGDYFYFSPSSKKVSGYTAEELFELGDIKYLLTSEYQSIVDNLRQSLEDGTVKLDEPLLLRMKRKDGELRWLETRVSVVPGIEDPNELNIMTASHDVTELVESREELKKLTDELERSSRLFRLLAENTNDFVAFRSSNGTYTYFSPQAEEYTGYSTDELYEMNTLMPLFHPDHHDRAKELITAMDIGDGINAGPVVWRFVRKQGDIRYNECTVSSMPNPEDLSQQGSLMTFHDITDLIENQNELEKSRDQLAAIAEELEEAKLSAESNLETIQRDIDLARAMQQAIVPRSFPTHPRYSAHAIMEAARQVGGDFYEFFQLDFNHVGVAIADVSGKGVPAAFFMAISRTLLETAAKSNPSPSAVLQEVNQRLLGQNPLFLFVTLFYGILNVETGTFVYSNGGHSPPMLLRKDGDVSELPLTGDRMLGIMDDMSFHEQEVQLMDGDTLFLFTDGITEAVDSKLSLFGEKRLIKHLSSLAAKSPGEVVAGVRDRVLAFAGPVEQSDDLTCLALRYSSAGDQSEIRKELRLKAEPFDPNAVIELEMVNDVQQVVLIHEQLSQFLTNWEVSKEVQFQVNVSLEEYVVNLISYGYRDDERHMIHMTVTRSQKSLIIEVYDDGVPFNPLMAPEADIGSSIENRQIGGLGIHIIRTYMDQLSYLSRDGINRFTMTKILG